MMSETTNKIPNFKENIGIGEKMGYGVGDLAGNLLFGSITAFMMYFYTDVGGIAAATVGTIMFVSKLLDGVWDLVMGVLVDRTKSKHGKARPWILWLAIPFGISMVLLFTVPPFGYTGKVIYAFLTYTLASTVIFTAINIPYGVLNSLMTQDQFQRTILNLFRMFAAIIGNIAVTIITLPMVKSFGGDAHAWQITFAIFGTIAAILFFVTFFTTKERVSSNSESHSSNVPIKEGVKALFKNKYWAIMLVFATLTFLGQGLSGGSIYFLQYVLGDKNLLGIISLAGMVPMIIGMLLSAPLIKRYGKRNTVLGSLILGVFGGIVIAINPSNVTIVLVGAAIRGLATGPAAGSMFAMISDTIEYGEWKTGIRNEGLVFSAASFGQKVGSGLGVALVGWILAIGGYSANAVAQPDSAIGAIKLIFVYLPTILTALQALVLIPHKLDKEYPQIVTELHERNTRES